MDIHEWWQTIATQFSEIGWLQWLGLIFGVSEVLLARNNNILLYPAGIIASAISLYLLWQVGLFAESLLNLYYVIMSVYGWWYWVKKKHLPPVRITRAGRADWLVVAAIAGGGCVVLYLILAKLTPSTVPALDAFVTATAWAGMWLLAKRKLENWVLLNLSNIVAIPLLFYKGLPLYALLTLFLFIVAVDGYFNWKKKIVHEATDI